MAKTSQPYQLLAVAAIGAVLLYAMNSYSGAKGGSADGMMDKLSGALGSGGPTSEMGPYAAAKHSMGGNAQPTESLQSRQPTGQSTYSESTLSASELLPKGEIGASWAAVNPSAMEDLKGQNFLQAGYHANINIIGISQNNRNPTYDIRSETPNPQSKVGPFLQTTIDPDPFRANRALDGLCG